ncbi:MAG: hypothetical protein VB980_07285, partial [Opitutales bacterium]
SPEINVLRSNMTSASRSALEVVDGFENYPPPDDLAKNVIDLPTLEMALGDDSGSGDDDSSKPMMHDFSTTSFGVLADVRDGGLKKDLNLLFELPNAPPGFGADDNSYLYDNQSPDLENLRHKVRTSRSGGNKTEPRWEDLRGFYREYKDASVSGAGTASFSPTGRYSSNTQRLPVVAKLQILFSYWARDIHGGWKRKYNPPRSPESHDYLVNCVIEPVITLWNPFDAPLSFREFRVNVRQIPVTLRWFINQNQVGPGWRHYSEIWQVSRNTRKGFDVRIKPTGGDSLITLAPGEVVTYSDGETSLAEFIKVHGKHDDWHGHLSARLDYEPGWSVLGGYYTDWLSQGRDVFPGNADDLIGVTVKGQRSRHAGGMGDFYVDLFCTKPNGSGGFIGGHRIQFRGNETNWLPQLEAGFDTPERTFGDVHNLKQPFMLLNVALKTEGDSRYPSLSWVHNSPINQLFHAYDLDEEHMVSMQYEMEMLPMGSFDDIPTVEVAPNNRNGYFGPGLYADKGLSYVTHAELPVAPLHSMGSLRHANVAKSHNQPLVSYVVGNSFAHPLLPADGLWVTTTHRGQSHGDNGDKWGPDYLIDHSYHANDRLWDEYFFSSIAPRPSPSFSSDFSVTDVFENFQSGETLLNQRLVPWKAADEEEYEVFDKLFSGPGNSAVIRDDAYLRSASNLMVKGSFNVNSTSPAAWAAMLGANNGADVAVRQPGGSVQVINDVAYPVSRFSMPNGGIANDSTGLGIDQALWSGFRSLDRYQIQKLAEKIVEQVKLRGPFLSLGEFINRRVSNDALGLRGAVQAALDDPEVTINEPFKMTSMTILESDVEAYGYRNPEAAAGLSGAGAPGFVIQADVLAPLAPSLSARSDTFCIRAYGKAPSLSGAGAGLYCEIIAQRLPEYVDPQANAPEDLPSSLSDENLTFGRRFKVTSFRWLR